MQSPPGGHGPGGRPPPGPFYGGPPGPGQPLGASKPITGSAQTMAMHALTIDPKTGLPKGEKPPASPAAVLSLVCGILLCLGPITGLTAIVAGVIAKGQVSRKPGTVGGAGMATAGILLGSLNLLGVAGYLVFWLLSGG